MKTSWRTAAALGAGMLLAILYATDQVLPATSAYQAQMRIWMAARATGILSLVLLALLVTLGILLSHPEQSRWKQAKRIFPWHESAWVFVMAFLTIHVVSIALDEYAGVGLAGALLPGLSEYRTAPVALGVIASYALLVTVLTARFTALLPAGMWLRLHRLSGAVLALAWGHGVLAGTDAGALRPLYWGIAIVVLGAGAYRYWTIKARGRPRVAPPIRVSTSSLSKEMPDVEPQPAP